MKHEEPTQTQVIPVYWQVCLFTAIMLWMLILTASAQGQEFTYVTNNGTITITGYKGFGGAVIIPSTINGLPVTRIGELAFYYSTNLTDVTIPDSVTSIGQWAFNGCSSLTSVTIPNSVTNIGPGQVFYSCTSLTAITVDALNSFYSSADGVLFNKSQTTLIQYPGGKAGPYTIPASVTTVTYAAFDFCTSLTSVTVPQSVASDLRFHYCTNLTEITVAALNSIYSSVDGVLLDKGQTALIQYPAGKAGSYNVLNSVSYIGYAAFAGSSKLTSIALGDNVTSIGSQAFSFCDGLTNVSIPSRVTNIGEYAFASCSSLTSVTIPNSVTNIGPGPVFYSCTSLTAITVDALNSFYSSADGVLFNKSQTTLIQYPGGKAGPYTIPASVTTVTYAAFDFCTSLTSVTVPQSVASDLRFRDCTSLTEITVAALNSIYSSVDGVLLDKGQTTLIQYPAGKAGSYNVLNSVSYIGYAAFAGSSKLTSIALGDNVTSIGSQAFSFCDGLTNVSIPGRVTNIGELAFYQCVNLTGVYFYGNAPTEGWGVLGGDTNATVYYLPGTTGWGATFGERPTAPWVLPNPVILNSGPSFGLQTNAFGFIISWATNVPVVVEACTDLASPTWSPLSTNTLTDGWSYFSDPQWANYPARFYRLRSP